MSLFIARLNRDITNEQLGVAFGVYGPMKRCDVIPGRGYGFVEYENKEDAERAIQEMKGSSSSIGEGIMIDFTRSERRPMGAPARGRGGSFERGGGRRGDFNRDHPYGGPGRRDYGYDRYERRGRSGSPDGYRRGRGDYGGRDFDRYGPPQSSYRGKGGSQRGYNDRPRYDREPRDDRQSEGRYQERDDFKGQNDNNSHQEVKVNSKQSDSVMGGSVSFDDQIQQSTSAINQEKSGWAGTSQEQGNDSKW